MTVFSSKKTAARSSHKRQQFFFCYLVQTAQLATQITSVNSQIEETSPQLVLYIIKRHQYKSSSRTVLKAEPRV